MTNSTTNAAETTHRMLFAPCAEGDHSDCIGFSNSLRRDAQLVLCSCECHGEHHEDFNHD